MWPDQNTALIILMTCQNISNQFEKIPLTRFHGSKPQAFCTTLPVLSIQSCFKTKIRNKYLFLFHTLISLWLTSSSISTHIKDNWFFFTIMKCNDLQYEFKPLSPCSCSKVTVFAIASSLFSQKLLHHCTQKPLYGCSTGCSVAACCQGWLGSTCHRAASCYALL